MIDNNIIRSLGAGSGVDSSGIVKQLVAIEKQAPQARLDAKKATTEAQISDFGLVSSALSTLSTAATALSDKQTMFGKTANYTASDAFTPVKLDANVLTGTYAFDIQEVAQAASFSSTTFSATTDPVGKGTLTLNFGEWNTGFTTFTPNADKTGATITIDDSNNTLQGLRDAINKTNIGVQASILKDGVGYKLLLTAPSGAKNQLSITAAESGGAPTNNDASDLSRFTFNTTAKQLNGDQLGKDAKFTVNGVTVYRANNKVDDVIEGLTFQLSKADPGKIVTVNVTDDTAGAEEKVRGFVDAYNEFLKAVKPAFGIDETTKKKGSLMNDALGKSLLSQVRTLIGSNLPGLQSTDFRTLSNVGIRTELDGTLSINEKDFTNAFTNHFALVQKLFAPTTSSTSSNITVNSYGKQTQPGTYDVTVTTPPKQGFLNGGAITGGFTFSTTGKSYSFGLTVNGVDTNTITLPDATSYGSGSALAAAVQSLVNTDEKLKTAGITLTVAYDTDHLVFTPTRFGSSSTVNIKTASADAIADLGLAVANGTAGVDVSGSINGKTAFGFGNVLRPELGDKSEGLNLIVNANTPNTPSKVSYSQGFGASLKALADKFLSTSGLITARKNDLTAKTKTYETEQKNIDRRIEGYQTRLTQQFIAMENILNSLKSSGTYLDTLLKTQTASDSK